MTLRASTTAGAFRHAALVMRTILVSSRPQAEVEAFARQLRHILEEGGRIRLVQVYTVARRTAEPYVSPLTDPELEGVAGQIRSIVDLPVSVYSS